MTEYRCRERLLFLDEGAVYSWHMETLIFCSLGWAIGECMCHDLIEDQSRVKILDGFQYCCCWLVDDLLLPCEQVRVNDINTQKFLLTA